MRARTVRSCTSSERIKISFHRDQGVTRQRHTAIVLTANGLSRRLMQMDDRAASLSVGKLPTTLQFVQQFIVDPTKRRSDYQNKTGRKRKRLRLARLMLGVVREVRTVNLRVEALCFDAPQEAT